MLNSIAHFFIGKNLPSFARAIATFVGTVLLSTVVFDPGGVALDPALGEAADNLAVPSAAQIQDGVTFGEALSVVGGILLIWVSRFTSFLRAKNLPRVAKYVGPLIGRSIPSLIRAALTAVSAGLAYLTASPAARPEDLADQPLTLGIGAALSFLMARVLSATEDAKRNPIVSRPPSLEGDDTEFGQYGD